MPARCVFPSRQTLIMIKLISLHRDINRIPLENLCCLDREAVAEERLPNSRQTEQASPSARRFGGGSGELLASAPFGRVLECQSRNRLRDSSGWCPGFNAASDHPISQPKLCSCRDASYSFINSRNVERCLFIAATIFRLLRINFHTLTTQGSFDSALGCCS
jgi:hypothetical protein